MYKKLKRTWSHNDLNYIPNFKETFPELNGLDNEESADRFIELGVGFYTTKEVPVTFWVRLTLPFALLTMLLMFIGLPLTFFIKGKWGYSTGSTNSLLNWFRSLGLQ